MGAIIRSRTVLLVRTALVLMGVIVNLLAALQHTRFVHRLRKGAWSPNHGPGSGVAVAIGARAGRHAVTNVSSSSSLNVNESAPANR